MMSLVAYGNSDSEEEENELNEESGGEVTLNGTSHPSKVKNKASTINTNVVNQGSVASGLSFSSLPQPATKAINVVEEEHDEFLKKKEKPLEKLRYIKKPVKINILSLNVFSSDEDEEDEPSKKKLKQDKASGLFALLPAPKVTPISTTSFIPNVLKKKFNSTKKPLEKAKPSDTTKPQSTIKNSIADDDDDVEVPETFDDETWQKVCGKQIRPIKQAPVQEPSEDISYMVEAAPEVEKPYTGLDNQAFKELIGNRKNMKENIEIIDIHEDEIRPDREEWLKSLTDPNCEPQVDVKNPVNQTCKVKNHITALAQKALANDKELQMRWAESRHNRRQTQAKYGF